jgi:chromosome partitioning protein
MNPWFHETNHLTSKDDIMPSIRPGAVIAVGNQKGGVGKSTNTVHLAAALGEKGYLSLIIDLDPSAGATKHLGIPPEGFLGTLELLTTEETPESLAVTEKLPKGVHLIPARTELAQLEQLLSKFEDRTRILDRSLKLARPLYDFIFLDTPPNPGEITTVAAYSSAEWFLLSTFPHPLAVGGMNEALKDIADVRTRRNPNLEVLGVIITSVDGRTNLWKEVETVINSALPGRGFQTTISQAVEVAKCPGLGKTLLQLKKHEHHPVSIQYRMLASEVEQRVLNREAFLKGELPLLELDFVTPSEQKISEADEPKSEADAMTEDEPGAIAANE